ncbi:sugar transferase [Streptomyces sp. NBC_00829]|uniref:sugar transferase n=1 Tax=Streptomyces sp. NBC_00829 TaxID=2903679 RepID=UPI00386C4585|nr:sugar transferase [Streptomyces sp. NBC_00829]
MPAKRVVDLTGGLILLLLLSPLLLTLAAATAAGFRGTPLARSERVGLGGSGFAMLTLRTSPASPVGRLLRRHGADRIPQLINVVRGQMSLVGPRPLSPEDSEESAQSPEGAVRARLRVRPGITGLWQISGRSDLPWEEMSVLDLHYVEQHWLGLDLLILVRTLPTAVLGRRAVRPLRLA